MIDYTFTALYQVATTSEENKCANIYTVMCLSSEWFMNESSIRMDNQAISVTGSAMENNSSIENAVINWLLTICYQLIGFLCPR